VNTVKTSYRGFQNLGRKISAHYKKVLNIYNQEEGDIHPYKCTKEECPVQCKCTQTAVIYNSKVARDDGITDTYIGLSEPQVKKDIKLTFQILIQEIQTMLHVYQNTFGDFKIKILVTISSGI